MKLPEIGDLVGGKYRLERVLGEGGFARVFAATRAETGRAVAIKALKPGTKGYDESRVQRFQRELRIIANLQSPSTLTLYDHGETDDGVLYMVVEYIEGQDLADAITQRGTFDEADAVYVLHQCLESLREAHEAGLLHRDIKPANIRIFEYAGDPLRVKVLDFGLAKSLGHDDKPLTAAGKVVGTPRFMSPEQLRGKDLTAGSDLYSLGLVAFEMLLGAKVGRTRDISLTQSPQIPADAGVHPELRRIVNRMLAHEVADRYATATEVIAQLGALRLGPRSRSIPPSEDKAGEAAPVGDSVTTETVDAPPSRDTLEDEVRPTLKLAGMPALAGEEVPNERPAGGPSPKRKKKKPRPSAPRPSAPPPPAPERDLGRPLKLALAVIILVVLALAARIATRSRDGGSMPPMPPPESEVAAAPAEPTSPFPTEACGVPPASTGPVDLTESPGFWQRRASLYIPSTYAGEAGPILLVYVDAATAPVRKTGLIELSEANAAPLVWLTLDQRRDSAIEGPLHLAARQVCFDPTRIYAFGVGLGADVLAHGLCETAVAGVAFLGARPRVPTCPNALTPAVLYFHDLLDRTLPGKPQPQPHLAEAVANGERVCAGPATLVAASWDEPQVPGYQAFRERAWEREFAWRLRLDDFHENLLDARSCNHNSSVPLARSECQRWDCLGGAVARCEVDSGRAWMRPRTSFERHCMGPIKPYPYAGVAWDFFESLHQSAAE